MFPTPRMNKVDSQKVMLQLFSSSHKGIRKHAREYLDFDKQFAAVLSDLKHIFTNRAKKIELKPPLEKSFIYKN